MIEQEKERLRSFDHGMAGVLPRTATSKLFGKKHQLEPTAVAAATHMVLYLNEQTFAGEKGAILAHEVREARRVGLPVEMLHECDPARGGCEFAKFFKTTPEDLLADGLYSKIANALHPGPHRDVSFALCAKSLGAVARGRSLAGARKELSRVTKTLPSVSSFLFKKGSSIAEKSIIAERSTAAAERSIAPDAIPSTKVDMTNDGETMAKEVSTISKV